MSEVPAVPLVRLKKPWPAFSPIQPRFEQSGDARTDGEEALQVAVSRPLDEIARHLRRHVETGDVDGPERRALRAADGGAGHRIDGVDVERPLFPGLQHLEQSVQADVVGDEVRRVLRHHDAAAEADVEPVPDARDGVVGRRRDRNDLDERHVPRRIEEVRPDEVPGEALRAALDEAGKRQPRRVGADDGTGTSLPIDPLEQASLRLESLDDGFDDPVGLPECRVVDGARAHECCVGRGEERVRLERERSLPSAGRRRGIDVQQVDLDAGIGHVRSDLGAHRSGADDDGSAKGDGHWVDYSTQTPNAERRTPNAERRTPNAERRTPNAGRRTPNAGMIAGRARSPNGPSTAGLGEPALPVRPSGVRQRG